MRDIELLEDGVNTAFKPVRTLVERVKLGRNCTMKKGNPSDVYEDG